MAAPSRNNQVNSRVTTNATSATLASYTPTSGSDRVLVVRASAMYGAQSSFTLSATFGGVSMTEAATATFGWTSRYLRVSIFYLINPSGSAGDIVVTASQTMNGFVVDAVTLLGAAQTAGTLIGSTDTDSGADITDNALSLTGCVSDSLVLAAVASNCGLAPTWTWSGATEDYELSGTASTAEMAGAGAYYATTASGTVNITSTRSDSTPGMAAVAVEFKSPATSISGTLSKTLGGVTLASTGKVALAGAVAKTLAGVTTTATGKVALTGSVAKTLSGVTLSATGKVAVSGTSAATLAGVTLQATGKAALAGALAQTLAGVTLSATGKVAITGSAAITLAGVTLATSGGFGQQSAGELAATLEGVSLVATGVLPITGTVAQTLGGASLSSTGAVRISGTLAAVLSNLTLSATGQLAESESRTGQLAATLAGVSLDSSGKLAIAGVAAISLSPLTLVATGREPLPPIVVAIGVALLTRGGMAVETAGRGDIILEGASAELEVIP